jgi:membrane protein DedA with SNARE-associated domain
MFDRIRAYIESGGYLGITLLMFLENLFPPIPSELIMPAAGFEAARGTKSLPLVILSGHAGSLLGALFWYYAGRAFGKARLKTWARRHGRWLTLKPRDVDRVDHWFHRHAGMAVLVGRVIPTVRTLISVPAGVFGMKLPAFLIFTTIGTFLWTAALASGGYLLASHHERVADYINPVATTVVTLVVIGYLVRVLTWKAE